MNKKTLSIFVAAALSSPFAVANTADLEPAAPTNLEQPQVASAIVTSLVIDAAQSAIQGKLKSVFSEALFGSGNTQLQREVTLSYESLEKIRGIVKDESVKQRIASYKSDLTTLKDLVSDYHASFDNMSDLEKRLKQDNLNSISTKLVNHEIFNNDYYKEYRKKIVQSHSLAVSLRVAVLAEKLKNGDLNGNIDYVNYQQSMLKDHLQLLGSETDSYIKSKFRIFEQKHCNGNNPVSLTNNTTETMSSCRFPTYTYIVIDSIGTIQNPVIEYTSRYSAERAMNSFIGQYKNMFKGSGFDSLVTRLSSPFSY